MNAGRLRHRITLQQRGVTQDTYGAEVVTWNDMAKVWATVSAISGREYVARERANVEVTYRIYLRWRSDVDTSWRIVFGAQTFAIQTVLPDERTRQLTLMCSETT